MEQASGDSGTKDKEGKLEFVKEKAKRQMAKKAVDSHIEKLNTVRVP